MGDFFMKKIFKVALITILSGAIFFGSAYAYLDYSFDKTSKEADQKEYEVPYSYTPENCGIAFVYPGNSATLTYLDFEKESIWILDIDDFDATRPEYYGYTADYVVNVSYELIEGIIDRAGGVELEHQNETLRYTGVQVIDFIASGQIENLKREIILQIFKKASNNDFSTDDLVYIIENSESTLSLIDCIDWIDYIKPMSNRVQFVN